MAWRKAFARRIVYEDGKMSAASCVIFVSTREKFPPAITPHENPYETRSLLKVLDDGVEEDTANADGREDADDFEAEKGGEGDKEENEAARIGQLGNQDVGATEELAGQRTAVMA